MEGGNGGRAFIGDGIGQHRVNSRADAGVVFVEHLAPAPVHLLHRKVPLVALRVGADHRPAEGRVRPLCLQVPRERHAGRRLRFQRLGLVYRGHLPRNRRDHVFAHRQGHGFAGIAHIHRHRFLPRVRRSGGLGRDAQRSPLCPGVHRRRDQHRRQPHRQS